jgi:rhodopsin domain-containing protein
MYITLGFVPGILSFTVPKFAVVLLLCNLLNPVRAHRWFLWTMAVINFIAITVCIVMVYASCDPPYAMWTLSVVPKCWNPNVVVYSSIFAGGKLPLRKYLSNAARRRADSYWQPSPLSWTCTSPSILPSYSGSSR